MDTAILEWLSHISEPHHTEVSIASSEVVLKCQDKYIAYDAWKNRQQLVDAGFDLSVWVGDRLYGKTLEENTMQAIQSSWASKNDAVLKGMIESCTVAIHSESLGYNCLAIQPFLGIEEIMCKPINQLLGKPANVATSVIGETKVSAITKAISSGGTATEDYDFTWNGAIWKKRITAVYLPGHSEVMVQTTDRDAWQTGYWRNFVKAA